MVKEADSLKDALKDKNEVRDGIIFKSEMKRGNQGNNDLRLGIIPR